MKFKLVFPLPRLGRFCFSTILILGLSGVFPSALGANEKPEDEIAAWANGTRITRSTFETARRRLNAEIINDFPNDKARQRFEFKRLRKRVIGLLIDEHLVSQQANRFGISVETEVNAELSRLCEETGYKSLADFRAAMEKEGIEMDDLRNRFRTRLQCRAILSQEVFGPIHDHVTENERKKYYRTHKAEFTVPGEVQLSEIHLSFTPGSRIQVRRKAREVVKNLGKAEFKLLVRKYSDDDRPSKSRDGRLPAVKETELPAELKLELDKIRPGQCTPILRTKSGYRIVRLDARSSPEIRPYQAVVNEITHRITLNKAPQAAASYFRALRSKARIRIAPAYKNLHDTKPFLESDPPFTLDSRDARTIDPSLMRRDLHPPRSGKQRGDTPSRIRGDSRD